MLGELRATLETATGLRCICKQFTFLWLLLIMCKLWAAAVTGPHVVLSQSQSQNT